VVGNHVLQFVGRRVQLSALVAHLTVLIQIDAAAVWLAALCPIVSAIEFTWGGDTKFWVQLAPGPVRLSNAPKRYHPATVLVVGGLRGSNHTHAALPVFYFAPRIEPGFYARVKPTGRHKRTGPSTVMVPRPGGLQLMTRSAPSRGALQFSPGNTSLPHIAVSKPSSDNSTASLVTTNGPWRRRGFGTLVLCPATLSV
jgi:hypothetical protein